MKNFFKNEWTKLREMTFAEKRQYIWEYYKIQIIAAVFVAFFIGSLINTWIINPPKNDYLYIAWLGPDISHALLGELGDSLSVIVSNPDRERVFASSYAVTNNPQMDSGLQQRFAAMLHTGGIDIFMTTSVGVKELAENGFSRNMDNVMEYVATISPALYQQVANQLITITFEHDGHTQTDIMAVSLAGTPLFEYLNIDANDLAIVAVANTRNFDRIAKALEAIFQWN